MLQLRSEYDLYCLCHSLCDASLDTNGACQDPLHTVDDTALPHIGKTWELKIASRINTRWWPNLKTQHHVKRSHKVGAAVLTYYAHFECSVIHCVSSQTCQELSETATSEAGSCSGSIQDIIGGHYPAFLSLLMKTEGEQKVSLTQN